MKRHLATLALVAASAAGLSAQSAASLGSVHVSQRLSAPEGQLEPGAYQLRLASDRAPRPVQTAAESQQSSSGAVGTSGQSTDAPSAPEGPWIEFTQNGEVKLRTMAVVPPDTMNIPAGVHAMRVRNDDDSYIRVSVKQAERTYLVYLPSQQ